MYLTKTFHIPLYGATIQFIVTSNIVKKVNDIYKKHNINLGWTVAPAGTMISLSLNKYIIVINKDFLTYDTCSHEIFHATMCLTSDRGVMEEESRCWVCGQISQEIFKFLELKKVKIG